VEPIQCGLCENREEADHWIELRHTGENDGAGIVGWDGIATARFRGKEISLQAIEFIKKYGNLDERTSKNIESIRYNKSRQIIG